MKIRFPPAALFFFLSAASVAFPQAPDVLADQVIKWDVYSAFGNHESAISWLWLRADGTGFVITGTLYNGPSGLGRVIGPVITASGFPYRYVKDSGSTARLLFPVNGTSEGYVLTFRDAVSGTAESTLGGGNGFGTFRLRPSQFGVGPLNLSTRAMITNSGVTIAGFVLPNPSSRFVLLRAIGPSLSKYGLTNNAGQVLLTVYDSAGNLIKTADWDSTTQSVTNFNQLFALCGAFPLNGGDGDKCALLELPPGVYSVKMAAGISGNGLIEVYFLP